jgi:hypothetical protein
LWECVLSHGARPEWDRVWWCGPLGSAATCAVLADL